MAYAKHYYERECAGKVAHETRQAAERAAGQTHRGDRRMHAYRCVFCREWHIGHRRAKQPPGVKVRI